MPMVACSMCGGEVGYDPYNKWRIARYCKENGCAKARHRQAKSAYKKRKMKDDPEWVVNERKVQVECQRSLRAGRKKKKEKAVMAAAARRKAESDAIEAAKAKERAAEAESARRDDSIARLHAVLSGLLSLVGGAKTGAELERFSARMLEKGIRIIGAGGTDACQATHASDTQQHGGP